MIPPNFEVILSRSSDPPHLLPLGVITLFIVQFEGGLRFPIPIFFQQMANYSRISLSQLAPNLSSPSQDRDCLSTFRSFSYHLLLFLLFEEGKG